MEILQLLFSWWWFGKEGRSDAADTADKFILPILLLVAAGCLVALAMWSLSPAPGAATHPHSGAAAKR